MLLLHREAARNRPSSLRSTSRTTSPRNRRIYIELLGVRPIRRERPSRITAIMGHMLRSFRECDAPFPCGHFVLFSEPSTLSQTAQRTCRLFIPYPCTRRRLCVFFSRRITLGFLPYVQRRIHVRPSSSTLCLHGRSKLYLMSVVCCSRLRSSKKKHLQRRTNVFYWVIYTSRYSTQSQPNVFV